MPSITREQFLAPKATERQKVDVPELGVVGGYVWVAVMSGTQRDEYEVEVIKDSDKSMKNMRARLVVRCAQDDDGKRLFTLDDVEAVGNESSKALERIVHVAQRLNRLTEKDMEELKGN